MTRTILLSAIGLAAAVLALEWLEYQYVIRTLSTEFYVIVLCLAFTALGLWTGHRLTARRRADGFELNEAALASLSITPKEQAVLARLAGGDSNKEIARALGVSPNTVKTHLASLYAKLDVSRRTQAIDKARTLQLIP